MKTAKKVDVLDEVPIEDCEKLLKHARNSASWYFMNGYRTEYRVRQKIIDKGFPDEYVTVIDGDDVHFIDEAIQHCHELHLVDDSEVARHIVTTESSKGHGISYIKQKIFMEGISRNDSEEFIHEFFDHEEAFDNALRKATRKWYRLEFIDQKEYSKAFAKILQEGFSSSIIHDELQKLRDELLDE